MSVVQSPLRVHFQPNLETVQKLLQEKDDLERELIAERVKTREIEEQNRKLRERIESLERGEKGDMCSVENSSKPVTPNVMQIVRLLGEAEQEHRKLEIELVEQREEMREITDKLIATQEQLSEARSMIEGQSIKERGVAQEIQNDTVPVSFVRNKTSEYITGAQLLKENLENQNGPERDRQTILSIIHSSELKVEDRERILVTTGNLISDINTLRKDNRILQNKNHLLRNKIHNLKFRNKVFPIGGLPTQHLHLPKPNTNN
eukprot:TRINITY_DN2837_c0_g1_i3.p1 TRINITY_DN2837_c0_g1~~TRINITY_DN2837_c0_g1_i3.p1  ORF type:complete len:262 (+),score=55.53 TRINITY_DN2837_c0_g1_i3:151-936(+)